MTLRPAELRGEKSLDQFPGQRVTDNLPSEANQVQIIILDALVRREAFVNQTRPHPRHFVRADRCPNPTSTDGHAPLHRSAGHRAGQRPNKIWIIILRVRLLVAETYHLMTGLPQHPDQKFL